MSYIIQPRTRAQIRQAIIGLFNGLSDYNVVVGTASSGSATTIVSTRLKVMPQTDTNRFQGSTVYIATGTGSGQYGIVSAFDPTTGTLTFPASTFSPAPANGSTFEVYTRFNKDLIEGAIDLAFLDGASRIVLPTDTVATALESILPNSNAMFAPRQQFRSEYPIPGQFLWLTGVDVDDNQPFAGWPETNYTGNSIALNSWNGQSSFQNGHTLRTTQLQSFQVTQPTWIQYASAYLYTNTPYATSDGSITATLVTATAAALGDGMFPLPGGSIESNTRLLADLDKTPTFVTFSWNNPILLQANTTYYLQLSGDVTKPFAWGVDATNAYPSGTAYYTWTATGSTITQDTFNFDYIFLLHSPAVFRPIPHNYWSIIEQDGDPKLHFDRAQFYPDDGTIIRIRGARSANDFSSSNVLVIDATYPEYEPIFLIYKAASLLTSGRLFAQGVSPDVLAQQGQLWAQMAEQHRRPFTLPGGANVRVR